MAGLTFRSVPMPDGDPEFGVPGPLLMLMSYGADGRGGREIKHLRIYEAAEARSLIAALQSGLDALEPGR